MLSRKQMRRLIKSVYGAGNQYGKELDKLYARANRQIKGEISAFLLSEQDWSGKPSKDDLEDVRTELEQANDDSVSSLVAGLLAAITLGHPTNGDVETARLSLPLINVAKKRHQQMQQMQSKVPQDVNKITHIQGQLTPELHRVPLNYNTMFQRQVSDSVTSRGNNSININRDIQQTMTRIRDIAKQASQSPKDDLNWSKMVDRALTGGKTHGGASGRAKMMIRTSACQELNHATIADLRARDVKKYRFMSLESINSCQECTDLDGNVYDVEDAEEGVNLPPMHPNCQCWIVEFEDE